MALVSHGATSQRPREAKDPSQAFRAAGFEPFYGHGGVEERLEPAVAALIDTFLRQMPVPTPCRQLAARCGLVLGPPGQAATMTNPVDELDEAMARLAAGDRAAFDAVFERLWPEVLRHCRQLLKNEADAWDAAQQALEKVLLQSGDYDSARRTLPWALAIASWECRTLLRRRSRRREQAHPVPDSAQARFDEETLVRVQLIEAALAALEHLSESDREVLVATFWEQAASVSGATLRKRRQRALERLRRAFRRLYGFD